MAVEWYLNQYECGRCSYYWEDEWSCTCDDRCPECNLTNSPEESIDMSRELTSEDYFLAAEDFVPATSTTNSSLEISIRPNGAWINGKIWLPVAVIERKVQEQLEQR
jgi:hypothetical protein